MVEPALQPENDVDSDLCPSGPIVVSACLAGMCTNYRGAASPCEDVVDFLRLGRAIPVCPEQLGGLPTPRVPAEIVGGTAEDVLDGAAKVMTRDGRDVTAEFIRGAKETLRLASLVGAARVILRENSPSCGLRQIHDGTLSGTLVAGSGVTAALLRRHGFEVESR